MLRLDLENENWLIHFNLMLRRLGFTLILLTTFSCEKDEIFVDDSSLIRPASYANSFNPFLPLDSNKNWIYQSTIIVSNCTEPENIDTVVHYDTLSAKRHNSILTYETWAFGKDRFNIQEDKIVFLVRKYSKLYDDVAIPMLYTNTGDTSWVFSLHLADGTTEEIYFEQTLLKENDRDVLQLKFGGWNLNKYDYYEFEKGIGIRFKTLQGFNQKITVELFNHKIDKVANTIDSNRE
ncbi:MAG: hypothetical protein JXQ87_03020 [Bacteroidia bacterium]